MTIEQKNVLDLLKRLHYRFANASELGYYTPDMGEVEDDGDMVFACGMLANDVGEFRVTPDTCLRAFEDALESGDDGFFKAVGKYLKAVGFIRFLGFYGLLVGVRYKDKERLIVPVLHALAVDMRQFHYRWEKWASSQEETKGKQRQKMGFRDYMSGNMEDIESKLEAAHRVEAKGRDALRKILDATIGKGLSEYPSFDAFMEEFGKVIGRSNYYEVLKEYRV